MYRHDARNGIISISWSMADCDIRNILAEFEHSQLYVMGVYAMSKCK